MARHRALDPRFAERLKAAMHEARVRPAQLATDLGVHPTTVSRWRRGECPDMPTLTALAARLGVGLEWLKTGGGERSGGEAPVAGDSGKAALTAFLETYPGDKLEIVRAAIRDLDRRAQPIPVWLTELYNAILVRLSGAEVAQVREAVERRRRGDPDTGPDRRAG